MITNGSGHLKGKCHDWTKNDDGIGNRLAGRVTACGGCAGSRRRRRRRWWRRRRTRGRWRLQRRFDGWLGRRSCWWLWRRSRGWLRRRSHGGHGSRSPWLWKTWLRGLLRLRQLSVLRVIRLALYLHLLSGDPIRKLPARGFRNLTGLTWKAGELRNASSRG